MGDVVIDVPPESQVHKQVIRKSATARDHHDGPGHPRPLCRGGRARHARPTGDFERLARALPTSGRSRGSRPTFTCCAAATRAAQGRLEGDGRRCTKGTATRRPHAGHLARLSTKARCYGLAIDLGSTTIAAHLCDLRDGSVLASSGVMNPQIRFGEDLMSRVSYVMMNPGGDVEMTRAVREAMNTLASRHRAEAGHRPGAIYEAVIVCNPVMHHLLLGIDPVELGQAPFALATSGSLSLARAIWTFRPSTPPPGSICCPASRAMSAPMPPPWRCPRNPASPTTGADRRRRHQCRDPSGQQDPRAGLFLAHRPRLRGRADLQRPARRPGAIERVEIDPVTKEPRFRSSARPVVGRSGLCRGDRRITGVTGICGSGIIEAVAEMRMAGWWTLGPDRIGRTDRHPRSVPEGRTHAYLLHDGSAEGGPRSP
jgi:uncharacterized 2Fe-2S/4Fe-4S cluster protein (DUF4445 family)